MQFYAFTGKTQYDRAPYALPSDLNFVLFNATDILSYSLHPSAKNRERAVEGTARLRSLIDEGGYGVVDASLTHLLFEKNVGKPLNSLVSAVTKAPQTLRPPKKNQDDPLELLGSAPSGDGLTLYFKKSADTDATYALRVGDTLVPIMYGLYPAAALKKNEAVSMTIPLTFDPIVFARVEGQPDLDSFMRITNTITRFEEIARLDPLPLPQ